MTNLLYKIQCTLKFNVKIYIGEYLITQYNGIYFMNHIIIDFSFIVPNEPIHFEPQFAL